MNRLPARRRALFAVMVSMLAGVVAVTGLSAADVYVHWRTQNVGGVNIWGYRGAPIGAKRAGEIRVAMLGGSTVFGWGLPAHESIPAFLEQRLNAASNRSFSVINLGAPGQGAYGFVFDLVDFEYLDYDIVCLYEGYNDLGPHTLRGQNNFLLWRRESPIFRWMGYHPILPIVLREKAQVMVNDTPGSDEVRFRPGLAARATAGAMEAVAKLTSGLTSSHADITPTPPNPATDERCGAPWQRYCGSVRDAIEWSLGNNKRVVFATQPYVSDLHIEQQKNVAAMLRARFGQDGRVRYVNLGHAIDMRDRSMAYDGLHLIARGNDIIAAGLVDAVLASAGLR